MILREKEYLYDTKNVLKERRIALRLKQVDAASRSGVNIATLRLFEKTGNISYYNLLKLLVLYRMDLKFISALTDRSWWTIQELERAEKFKSVR